MKHDEAKLSENVADYLKSQNILYRYDIADMNLTAPQAGRMKRLQMTQRGYPDLFICHPSGIYHGMYIELKKDESEVFNKNGTYKKKRISIKRGKVVIGWYDHIQEQLKCQELLRAKGYHVVYGFGFKDTIEKIIKYLKYNNVPESEYEGTQLISEDEAKRLKKQNK